MLTILKTCLRKPSGRKPHGSGDTPRSPQGLLELEAEKEARRRMQAPSGEDRVLQELEKIAFGDGAATGKLKALEMLIKHIGLYTPKEVPEVEMCEEEIRTEIQRRLEVLLD